MSYFTCSVRYVVLPLCTMYNVKYFRGAPEGLLVHYRVLKLTCDSLLQVDLYQRFVHNHPHCPIMLRSFIKLRPFFVIRCKERNVCCCRYHIQVLFLLEALNAFRDPNHGAHTLFHCICQCSVCGSNIEGICHVGASRFSGVTSMWMSILCEKAEDAEFHNLRYFD